MAAVVRAGAPPAASLTAMPMAVVMLLGRRERVSTESSRNRTASPQTQPRLVRVPATTPARMAGRSWRSRRNWACSGMARQTVAGVSSQEKASQWLWYVSLGMPAAASTTAVRTAAIRMGLKMGSRSFCWHRRPSS